MITISICIYINYTLEYVYLAINHLVTWINNTWGSVENWLCQYSSTFPNYLSNDHYQSAQ